jgi:Uma2 family endonuclease
MEASAVAAPAPRAETDHDHIVVLAGATWADFQRVLEVRGERPVPRLAYLEGSLELMTPSRTHESVKSMIGCLIEAWCLERGLDITPYGSWTLESKRADRGVEPDECYVLGDSPEPERPDLAIEVIWTSGGVDKLDVYRRLGVAEVWVWRDATFALFALRGEQYEQIPGSELLPGLDHEQLAQFIDLKPMTRAVRAYRKTLRDASD